MTNKYPQLKAILEPMRARAGIGTQTELASLLGATQQTVSRWEKGESRPREKEVPRLASVLGVDVKELLAAADYGVDTAMVASVDKPFPVHGLTPESFERFCFYLLQKLYPDGAQVHRVGQSGHTQGGIDISARGADWLHTFQCKRVIEFGPKKVETAVKAQSVAADRKVLLLSCVASPQAREGVAKNPGWEIWDREDISARVRSLPMQDQRDLVQVFFRSQRFELLGELNASPWQTVSAFFEPFNDSLKLFNHNWTLVGLTVEAHALQSSLESESVHVTMLVGAAGGGKSRLLRHVLGEYTTRRPGTAIWVLSPSDPATPKSLEELGRGEKLLVVDDAHDRDDLGVLMRFCGSPENRCRLLLALRPYGHEVVRNQAASIALSGDEVKVITLSRPSLEETTKLATEALEACNGPAEAAKDLAKLTHGSALATVLGAQIVAKEGIHPIWMSNDAEFQTLILSRFQDVIIGGIATGRDIERLQGVLRIVSLVQPVLPDEPALLSLIETVERVQAHDATRLLKTLVDAGVLFRRGLRYRLSPDLLADSIIERYCLDTLGAAEYIQRVFEKVEQHGSFLKNLLLNLGRLDWRRREGATANSTLLAGIWSKLRWFETYFNPHVEAAAAVAYYQPSQAIAFAKQLIRQGHGDSEQVCETIRNAAHNFDFLDQACMLLWQAGTDGRGEEKSKAHGIRVLRELASYEPNKPPEFIANIVDFAIEALDSKEALGGSYAPFEVLEGALATEGHTSWAASSRSITLSAYAVPQDEVRDIRAKIVYAIFRLLVTQPVKRAFQAARALQNVLSTPSGLLGMRIDDGDQRSWMSTHRATLNELLLLLSGNSLPAVILVRVAESVHWHAFFGEPETREPAQRVLEHLSRDLEAKLTRGLMDGWGSETWPVNEETDEPSGHEADTKALLEELATTYPDAKELYSYVASMMQQLADVGALCNGSQHVLLNRLIRERLDVAQEVVRRQVSGEGGALAAYGGVGLGALLNSQTEESEQRVQQLMQSASSSAIEMVAEAYVRFEAKQSYTATDLAIFRTIFQSKETSVLRWASSLLRVVAQVDARLAAELVCLVELKAAGRWVDEFFASIGHLRGIPEDALSNSQFTHLVAALVPLEKLDDHWTWRFLKLAVRRVPGEVVALTKRRLELAAASDDWRSSPLSPRDRQEKGLNLLKVEGWQGHLVGLLEWGLQKIDTDHFRYYFGSAVLTLCGGFDAAALGVLLTWLRNGGDYQNIRVVSAVVRDMPNRLVYDHPSFVQDVLHSAQEIGNDAVESIRSTIYAVSVSGIRSGTPGEPFPFDLKMGKYSNDMLAKLSRFDPAYDLYSSLLAHARDDITRQLRQKDAMAAEDEERG